MVQELLVRFRQSPTMILVNYRGLNVGQMTDLRRRLRAEGVNLKVVKNSMVERALQEEGMGELAGYMDGPTAIAFVDGDPVVPAKVLAGFAKESKLLTIQGGWLEGILIDNSGVVALSELPGRDELVARVVGGIAAPLTGLATVTAGPIRGLVNVLNAIKDQQGTEAA